jgi:hypothetical protein
MGEQYVGIDLHRRRSVIVRMTPDGEVLETVRVDNDPVALSLELAKAGPDPEVVLEATYGWYWAADLLQASACRAACRVSSSWSLAEVSMGPFHHAGELPHAGDALDGPPRQHPDPADPAHVPRQPQRQAARRTPPGERPPPIQGQGLRYRHLPAAGTRLPARAVRPHVADQHEPVQASRRFAVSGRNLYLGRLRLLAARSCEWVPRRRRWQPWPRPEIVWMS